MKLYTTETDISRTYFEALEKLMTLNEPDGVKRFIKKRTTKLNGKVRAYYTIVTEIVK